MNIELTEKSDLRSIEATREANLTVELSEPLLIVNGMSNNTGIRWDLNRTAEAISYTSRGQE